MSKKVCVSGLGTIGLPIACVLATSGYSVLGVDIDQNLIDRLCSANICHSEPGLQNLLLKAIQSENISFSKTVAPADIHIVAVPTLLDTKKQPDISFLYAAVNALEPFLRPHDLVIIESTCPIATTEKIALQLHKSCPEVQLAYCPERVLPGNLLHELIHNDRIVGGINEASTNRAVAFYQSFIKAEVFATNARTAEMVKLAENTYRDINIAYANELSMIADSVQVDTNEVIRLANRHPRVQILNPGPGVGGYCITVNPWFLVASAPNQTGLIEKARQVNVQKTQWVIEKIEAAIKKQQAKTVACLGLTYKANVADLRESSALMIVQALEKEVDVLRVDPFIPLTKPLDKALEQAEMIIGLVAHDAFLNIPARSLQGKTLLDFCGLFK